MTKEYEVSYRMYGWYTIKVTADDEDSALELANAMFESVSDEEIVSKTYFEFDKQTDPYIEEV